MNSDVEMIRKECKCKRAVKNLKGVVILLLLLMCASPAYSANEFELVNDLWVAKNTGLGMTAPLARLHIYGAGTGTGFALRIADTTPTDRLAVLDNGNVGIGLTNPAAKLDVSGQVKISGGSPGASKVLISDANGLGSWGTAPGANGWTASGTSVYTTTITDNVGIGTTTPLAKLHIIGAGTGTGFALSLIAPPCCGGDPTEYPDVVVLDDGRVGIGDTAPYGLLQVGTWPLPGLLVSDSADNVGIGTTAPIRPLQIGEVTTGRTVVDAIARFGINTASPGVKLQINYTGMGLIQMARFHNNVAGAVDSGTYITFAANTSTGPMRDVAGVGGRIIDITDTSPQGVLVFLTSNTVPIERARIDNNGNLGIGTTTPLAKLHIMSAGTGTALSLLVANQLSDRLAVLDNGNVGIGTSAPLALLQLGTSPNPILFVTAPGNVGIGTTNPEVKLEIKTASNTPFYLNIAGGKLLMKSPDSSCSACGPDNSGAWSCASITCP